MLTTLPLSFLAGILSTLSPCVLPVLPLILTGMLAKHRAGPLAFALGMALAFGLVGVLALGAGAQAGLSREQMRLPAAALLATFGAVMALPPLQTRFASATQGLATSVQSRLSGFDPQGLPGQFLLGAMIGLVWTPCIGPTLGAAMGLAARGENLADVSLVMLVFALGAAQPLLLLAYGGRQALLRRRESWAGFGVEARRWLGWALIILAIAVVTGLDKRIEAGLVALSPDWLTTLTTSY